MNKYEHRFIIGFISGLAIMFVMLTFVLKTEQYLQGYAAGTFQISRQIIVDLARPDQPSIKKHKGVTK